MQRACSRFALSPIPAWRVRRQPHCKSNTSAFLYTMVKQCCGSFCPHCTGQEEAYHFTVARLDRVKDLTIEIPCSNEHEFTR